MTQASLAVVVVALAVLAASLTPVSGGSAASVTSGGGDKLLHLFGYGVLTVAVAAAVRARRPRRLVGVVLAVTAFGAGIELLQPFVGRTASPADALANLAGAVAGVLAWQVSRSR